MRPGRGRPAAIAAAAAIATTSQSHKRSNTPTAAAVGQSSSSGTAGNKSKQCIVRLEKVNKKEEQKKDEANVRKLTTTAAATTTTTMTAPSSTTTGSGPVKRRLVTSAQATTSAPTPPPPQSARRGRKQTLTPTVEKMHVDEDLSDYNLVTARARRTPKPNPKYSSEDVITSYAKARSIKSEDESDRGEDFIDSADDFELNSSDIKDDLGDSDDDFEEDLGARHPKRSKSTPPTLQKGRIAKSMTTVQKPITMATEIVSGNKRKLGVEHKNRETYVIAHNKRLNIEMYDASDSDISTPSPTTQRALRNVTKSSSLDPQRQTSLLRPMLKTMQSETPKGKPIQILERRKESTSQSPSTTTSAKRTAAIRNDNKDDDVQLVTSGAASTVDDFETMPTFTIVNINDIINKKSDDLLKLDAVKKVLSEKLDTSPPRSPFTRKTSTPINNNLTKALIRSGETVKSSAPPRILNSVVGKRTRPISPIVTPKDVRKLPTLSSSPPSSSSSFVQRQLKENITSTASPTTAAAAAKKIGTSTTSTTLGTRKLPNDRVVVQRQGNRLVKKITCFETWYVINLPSITKADDNDDTDQQKALFDMSLVELGNRIKEISLPDNWNYKVTLQKLSPAQLKRSDLEPYTGDVNDSNISDEDKIKYQPINIMFRRMNKNSKIRMPYDRAVIIKNHTYFLNIDGKNIKLCNGSPNIIKSLNDISVLLEIMDELTLNSDFVAPSSFIL